MKESSTVKRTIDPREPPRVSAAQKARLAAVAAMPDEGIDYSDAPHLPNAVWTKAAEQLPHTKRQVTLRLDADVLDYFRLGGARYQSRINAVLRSYVNANQKLRK